MSGITLKQNAFKFEIVPHKQKSIVEKFWQEEPPPHLANGALCLSTPKHNGKSGTGRKMDVIVTATECACSWSSVIQTNQNSQPIHNGDHQIS
jgi:hypothetical protein